MYEELLVELYQTQNNHNCLTVLQRKLSPRASASLFVLAVFGDVWMTAVLLWASALAEDWLCLSYSNCLCLAALFTMDHAHNEPCYTQQCLVVLLADSLA